MVIDETPFACIEYFSDSSSILITWKKLSDLVCFKSVYNKVLDYAVKKYKIRYYCTDLRTVGSLTHEQEAWLISDYYDAVYSELKDTIVLAVVVSDEHFNAIIHNYQLPSRNQQPEFVEFNYFTDLGQAMHWLGTKQKGQDAIYSLSAS